MFSWIRRVFAKLTTSDTADRIARLAVEALPIVRTIAALTPTRSDDEVVRLFETYGFPYVEKFLALPQGKRGLILLDVATSALERKNPNESTRVLASAVQAAYIEYRGGQA